MLLIVTVRDALEIITDWLLWVDQGIVIVWYTTAILVRYGVLRQDRVV
jgi:hypothetical protein